MLFPNEQKTQMRYIFSMTDAYAKKAVKRFFMPGHKGKTGYPRDLTEVDIMDDLACPDGAILNANKRIARLYDMDYATIATCGSTGCIHAMLLCAKGKVLIGRDAHKSAVNAIYLFNIPYELMDDVSTKGILKAIEDTQAKTLYLTYPNYYGNGVDVDAVIKAAKAKGMIIIADCAHGAHFICEKRMPKLPGADMLCVSVHKTLGALTGGAAVMCKAEYADELKDNFFRIQSTSPSYLIMESIDDAYAFVEDNQELMSLWVDRCLEVRQRLGETLNVADNLDPTRIVVSCDGYTGYELYDMYRKRGIIAEMADLRSVVFLTSPYDIDSINSLLDIEIERRKQIELKIEPPLGKVYKDIFWVKGKKSRLVHYTKAQGMVACKPIGAYPPGTAAVMPGEIITADIIEYMQRIFSYGGKLFGTENEMIQVVECL